jgi:hypothetical protein
MDRALTALRTALEQPEQEQAPDRRALQAAGDHPAPCARHCEAKAYEIEIRSMKAALRKALEQPEQHPVAFVNADHLQGLTLGHYGYAEIYTDESEGRVPVYTTPPTAQRPWVGLTEGERNDLEDYCKMTIGKTAFDAIEARLKERNT